jgi:hypothetical protein
MSLEQILQWLRRKTPEEDTETRVAKLVQSLNGRYHLHRLRAEQTIAEMSYYWEDYYGAEFMVAVLKALEQRGSSRILPCIEHLANEKPRSAAQQRVRAAAQACLPSLLKRAERERLAETLLRPTATPATPVDDLLRPAQDAAEIAPQELLRSTGGNRS